MGRLSEPGAGMRVKLGLDSWAMSLKVESLFSRVKASPKADKIASLIRVEWVCCKERVYQIETKCKLDRRTGLMKVTFKFE